MSTSLGSHVPWQREETAPVDKWDVSLWMGTKESYLPDTMARLAEGLPVSVENARALVQELNLALIIIADQATASQYTLNRMRFYTPAGLDVTVQRCIAPKSPVRTVDDSSSQPE